MKILVINGPNLNLLGTREPEIYGNISMEDYLETLKSDFNQHPIDFFQSNVEGELINRMQQDDFDALVINPGAYTHYSYAIADAIKAVTTKVVEVHISDIYAREGFRATSVTGVNCLKIISGKGLPGYVEAVEEFLK